MQDSIMKIKAKQYDYKTSTFMSNHNTINFMMPRLKNGIAIATTTHTIIDKPKHVPTCLDNTITKQKKIEINQKPK